MPTAPPRLCPRGHVVNGRGPCPTCEGVRVGRRPSADARGYGARWTRLRNRHAAAFPLCLECSRRGIVRPMRDVDHVRPFDGPDDPLRFDASNLQSLCGRCHRAKTRRERPRRQTGGDVE